MLDNNPPMFIGGCSTNVYWGNNNDDFTTPSAPAPRAGLLADLQTIGVTSSRTFDVCGVNQWFTHSFTNLPKRITAAYLEIRVKPCGDICDNDTMHLWFVSANNPKPVFNQYLAAARRAAEEVLPRSRQLTRAKRDESKNRGLRSPASSF